VGGVQPQSETVWRQAEKYHVPRIAFVNKLDRAGADFFRTVEMMRERLGAHPLVVQLPLGNAESFCGVIDLLHMQAIRYEEDTLGATFQITDIPADSLEQAQEYHLRLIEELAEFDEDIMEKYLGDEPVPAAL
jgi:elongation factor G